MGRRPRPQKNPQAKAFELFSRGRTVFYVAQILDITIAEARDYDKLFRQSETVSPEHKRDIDDFIESSWKKEREESLQVLSGDLSLLKKKMEYVKLVDECIEKTREFATEADEVVVFLKNFDQVFHWMKVPGESRLIDIIRKMCDN